MLLLNVVLSVWSHASGTTLFFKREVGILKAVGWSVMDIIRVRLFSTAIIALLACLLGLFVGLLYVYLGAPGIREYLLGWAGLYPEFRVPLCVRADSLVTLLAVGTVPMLAAVLVPCWLAAISEPARSMRGE